MAKKKSDVRRRAWNILRLALLWARKGGVFRRRMMMDLRLVTKYLKSLGQHDTPDRLHYGERQLSFDDTPIIQVKMHRPASVRFLLPCIGPQEVDFDCDDNDQFEGSRQISFLKGSDDCDGDERESVWGGLVMDDESEDVEEGIDTKAERFITNFYQQMKLQRQISYLEYNEMLNRGAY